MDDATPAEGQMTQDRSIHDDLNIRRSPDEIRIDVGTILRWQGPPPPAIKWVTALVLSPDATPEDVYLAAQRVLSDERFFGVCERCGEHVVVGRLHEPGLCQMCAIREKGIVF